MRDLRGDHGDAPPDPPDHPAPEPPRADHARPPTPESRDREHSREAEPGTTNDPRAIRAAFREAESPPFATPHVELRYVTDPHPDTGPASPSPYRTTHDRPPPKPDPPDTPTHHAPDLEPPTGPELTETDAPSRGAELRKQLFDEENLGDIDDVLDHVNEAIDDIWVNKPDRGPSTHTQAREPHSVLHAPDHALDTRDALTAMFFTGILLGETVRVVYRKASELKERRQHAGHG